MAAGASRVRPVALSAYVTGFVAVFVLAAGAGLGGLFAAGQLNGGLLALTLAGLGVFVAASVLFYRAVPRPIAVHSASVREMMADPAAGPLPESGLPQVASLARAINELVAAVRAGSAKVSELASTHAPRRPATRAAAGAKPGRQRRAALPWCGRDPRRRPAL